MPAGATAGGGATLAELLAARLTDLWGAPVTVDGLQRLSGGASRTTWSCDATTGAGHRHRLIVRCDPGAKTVPSATLELEAAAFAAAAGAGVPVPAICDAGGEGGALGVPYLLMERLDGETLPRRLLRDDRYAAARAGLAGELGRALGRIHGIDPAALPGLERVDDPLEHLLARYTTDAGATLPPGLEIGRRWLVEHRPEAAPAGVVHGDFRLGNLLLAPDGLRAVLDWELVHLGDPLQDLGWVCAKVWRFGGPAPVAGTGDRGDLVDGYAEVRGWRPTDAQLDWWELYGTLRWGLICQIQAQRHLSGLEPSVELAAIGRRACEQEYDVLLHLGLVEPETVADPLDDPAAAPDPAGNAPHAAPDTGELLGAVRHFLATDVAAGDDDRLRFHTRVAGNALKIVERQLRLGAAQRAAHQERLARLGCADDADLSRAIRSGALDARWDEVVDAVRASVRDQLLVANPRHLATR